LVRKLCDSCKRELKLPKAEFDRILKMLEGISLSELNNYGVKNLDPENVKFFEGAGCNECSKTGYKGRLAIYECVDINNEMREAITEKDEVLLGKVAQKQGMLNMRQDGLLKAIVGLTSVSEVERMTGGSLTVGEFENDLG
jgi:type II secretory ATPase GspE/PulE/Tfp pilus assembly ATPase PilB-like protein